MQAVNLAHQLAYGRPPDCGDELANPFTFERPQRRKLLRNYPSVPMRFGLRYERSLAERIDISRQNWRIATCDLGIHDAPLYNFLGISNSRTGQLKKAVANYKQALEVDPKLAEAHLNLGFAYKQLNDSVRAGQEYAEACRLEQKFCQFAGQ